MVESGLKCCSTGRTAMPRPGRGALLFPDQQQRHQHQHDPQPNQSTRARQRLGQASGHLVHAEKAQHQRGSSKNGLTNRLIIPENTAPAQSLRPKISATMLHFLPPPLLGALAGLLMLLNILLWVPILLAVSIVKLLLPFKAVRLLIDPLLLRIAPKTRLGSEWLATLKPAPVVSGGVQPPELGGYSGAAACA